jgi:hypothetical protein
MLKFLRNNQRLYFLYTWLAGNISFFRFMKVRSLVVFLGYPRSGSSTLGSILDAHRNVLIAHELNVLKYLRNGFGYKQIFFLLAKNSKIFTKRGRISSGYDGVIKGQFNGKAKPCFVIGDKKAGATSKLLGENGLLAEKLLNLYCDVKWVHIVRNPFDMIATEAYKGNNYRLEATEKRLLETIDLFRKKFDTVYNLIKQEKYDIFTLKHEDLLENPQVKLTELLIRLNLENYPGYLESVCAHLFKKAHQSRHDVNWTEKQKTEVDKLIARYDFLSGYSFEG